MIRFLLCVVVMLFAVPQPEAAAQSGIGPFRAGFGAFGTNRALVRNNRAAALNARQLNVQQLRFSNQLQSARVVVPSHAHAVQAFRVQPVIVQRQFYVPQQQIIGYGYQNFQRVIIPQGGRGVCR